MLVTDIAVVALWVDQNDSDDEPTVDIKATADALNQLARSIDTATPCRLVPGRQSGIVYLDVVCRADDSSERTIPPLEGGPAFIDARYVAGHDGSGIVTITSGQENRHKFAQSIRNVSHSLGHAHFEWYNADHRWYSETVSWIVDPVQS